MSANLNLNTFKFIVATLILALTFACITYNMSKAMKPKPMTPSAIALESRTLTIVSMNIAGCVPSKEAPSDWDETTVALEVRKELLRTKPDILALQEFPGGIDTATQYFDGYQVVGARHSHADQVVLLVRNGILAKVVPVPLDLPAVMAELSWKEDGKERRLLVASVHLAPFQTNAPRRETQIESLLAIGSSMAEISDLPIIIAGDTNMRESEDSAMEGGLLQLSDAWKVNGSNSTTKFSWDTIDHGTSFNRYYGSGTRQYQTRYDRIYFKIFTPSNTHPTVSIEVPSFDLIANQPVTSKYHFLSDHFGLSTILNIKWDDIEENIFK